MLGSRLVAKPELRTKREAFCSQEEMAGFINIETGKQYGRTFYGNIETGARPATPKLALIIARILKSDVADLFSKAAEGNGQEND